MKLVVTLVPLLWLTQITLVSSDAYGHFEVSATGHTEGGSKKGGAAEKGNQHKAYDTAKKAEKSKKHDEEVSKKGVKFSEIRKTKDEEKGGKKKKHFSEGFHESSHSKKGGSNHGLKHASGTKKKKANYEKGFREKYHKDELMHHDSFFSTGQQLGDYTVYGKKGKKHSSFVAAKHAKDTHKKVEEKNNHGKKSKKAGGHKSENKKGHRNSKESKTSYEKGGSYGNKGGKKGGKQYKYKSGTK